QTPHEESPGWDSRCRGRRHDPGQGHRKAPEGAMTPRRWQVVIASPAARDIDRLAMRIAAAALEAIHSIAANPRRMGKPLHLELKGQWSARRGPYRILQTGFRRSSPLGR